MAVVLSILFLAQNLLFAVALHGPKSHQNLFNQLVNREHVFLATFPAFFVLTLLVQVLPLVGMFSLFGIKTAPAITMDAYAGFVVWSMAFIGYSFGVIAAKWRHWSVILPLFALAYLFIALEQNITLQLIIIAAIVLFGAVVLIYGPRVNQYLICLPMMLGMFVLLSGVSTAMLAISDDSNWQKNFMSAKAALSERKTKLQSDAFSASRLDNIPQTFNVDFDFRLNWLTNEVVATKAVSQALAKTPPQEMTRIWQLYGDKQYLDITYSFLGKPVMVFENGIYQINNESKTATLWERDNNEPLQWFGKFYQLTGRDIVFFGGLDFMGWLHWDIDDKVSTGTLPIDGNVRYAAIANGTDDPDRFTLVVNTDARQQFVYDWRDFTQSPTLVATNNIDIDYSLQRQIKRFISTPLAMFDSTIYPSGLSKNSFQLMHLICHVLAVIATLLYFSADTTKEKSIKISFVAIFAWPALLTLMVVFKRNKAIDWEGENFIVASPG